MKGLGCTNQSKRITASATCFVLSGVQITAAKKFLARLVAQSLNMIIFPVAVDGVYRSAQFIEIILSTKSGSLVLSERSITIGTLFSILSVV